MIEAKIFEEPMKIQGYMTDEDLHDLDLYGEYYMIIKQKYTHDKNYELLFERLDFDMSNGDARWVWDNDWWEGQQDVLLLGYFEAFAGWSDEHLLKFIEFLKGVTV